MINMSKPPRAKAAAPAPSEISLEEMVGPEGDVGDMPPSEEAPTEYPMQELEMKDALESMGWTLTPPGGEPAEEAMEESELPV
jgi:hypothetical protein